MANLNDLGVFLVSKQERFAPFALECLEGRVYTLSPHQILICQTLDRVMSGEISRLIINIPPGFSKTALAVWSFVSRGFAYNPASKFLHISYSDTLVQDNSSNIRTIMNHSDFKAIFPYVEFKADTKSKGLWKTNKGGAFRASASGGAITGFRAGAIKSDIFAGALIIDDPIKPDDAFSDGVRGFINNRWENVFRSRLAHNGVPVIVIMQRLHEDDFTAHLLKESGEEWHHLVLPSYVSKDFVYDIDGKGIYIPHNLQVGSLWSEKMSDEKALSLMHSPQYSQNPKGLEGEVFLREWFLLYEELPPIKSFFIFCDTASKTGANNDFSVFAFFGIGFDNKGYLIDIDRFKMEVPFLKDRFINFYWKCKKTAGDEYIKINIEDANSGTGLIQSLRQEYNFPRINAIQRRTGKVPRAIAAAPKIKDGFLNVPKDSTITPTFIEEFVRFRVDDTHLHDDQIDPTLDFLNFEIKGWMQR